MKQRKIIHWRKIYALFMACFFSYSLLMAQSINVKGTVVDERSEPIIGVSVLVKGTTTGVVTDLDGNFNLSVPSENAVLVATYVSYIKQEIKVGTKRVFNVVLKEDLKMLDEVVVIGYGVQKRANLTGAVGSVDNAELTSRVAPSTTSLLQGRMPGLQITQNSAMPGSEGVEMRIRGMGTFSSAGNNPLILIDGVEGDMSKLNPNMIESVSILKDASSAAIYGSRAANGVILVTTRSGKEGRLNIEYNYN